MKTYPLEVQELREFEGGHLGWWSKGHHNPYDFLFAIDDEKELKVPIDRVRHEWWRCMPVNVAGEQFTLTIPAKPHTRGAFPVTVVE